MPALPDNRGASSVPPELARFIDEFNQREYFRAHDTLEAAWKRSRGSERVFLQGLIQIAVGLAHVQRGNLAGALAQLDKGSANLIGASDALFGIDVLGLQRQATVVRSVIQVLGPSGLRDFPWARAPVISRTATG